MAHDETQPDFSPLNTEVEITPIPDAQRRMGGESRSGIYRALARGELKAVKRGRRTMIVVESIRQRILQLQQAQFGNGRGGK